MKDFLTALALVLVIEGIAYALFPGAVKRMMESVRVLPDGTLRGAGLLAALAGLGAVWLIRSLE